MGPTIQQIHLILEAESGFCFMHASCRKAPLQCTARPIHITYILSQGSTAGVVKWVIPSQYSSLNRKQLWPTVHVWCWEVAGLLVSVMTFTLLFGVQSEDSMEHLSAEERACLMYLEETIEALEVQEDSGLSNDEPESVAQTEMINGLRLNGGFTLENLLFCMFS